MATKKRELYTGQFYHVYNRGSNKQTLFHEATDYKKMLNAIIKYKNETGIIMLAYCLMPNHFHFLLQEPALTPGGKDSQTPRVSRIGHFMSCLQTSYSKYFFIKHKSSGHVFQGRFQSKHITTDAYVQFLSCYIHYNPQEAMLVDNAVNWQYSSLKEYLQASIASLADVSLFPYEGNYHQLYQSYLLFKKEKDKMIKDFSFDD